MREGIKNTYWGLSMESQGVVLLFLGNFVTNGGWE